jgi:hypothetical protein
METSLKSQASDWLKWQLVYFYSQFYNLVAWPINKVNFHFAFLYYVAEEHKTCDFKIIFKYQASNWWKFCQNYQWTNEKPEF